MTQQAKTNGNQEQPPGARHESAQHRDLHPLDQGKPHKTTISAYYWSALMTALIAGAFSLTIIAVLIAGYLRTNISDLLVPRELASLQQSLRENPGDETIKEQIRNVDLQLRKDFFRRQRLAETGPYLLLVGIAVFLFSIKLAFEYNKKQPLPQKVTMAFGQNVLATRADRFSVSVFGIVLAGLAVLFVITSDSFPAKQSVIAGTMLERPDGDTASWPSVEELNKNWPRFRGHGGQGISAYANPPTSWDNDTGQKIVWKTPVPLKGASSPVVWNDRIILTGATAEKHEIYCFDTISGRILWKKNLTVSPGMTETQVWDEKTHAASTPVTDGHRICAIFANGDLTCLDFNGNELWSKSFGPLKNSYGHASSLDMFQNRLIVLLDQQEADNGASRSRILALDVSSGRTVWETLRPTRASWTSPIIINAAGHDQIITSSMPWVISYDVVTGAEIWKVNCLEGDIVPSPIYAGGLVFAIMELSGLTAISPDGTGDVTATRVLWKTNGDFPSICCPVSNGNLLFLPTSAGLMTCWDIATRTMVWEQDLEVPIVSSPTLVGENIYLVGEGGEGIVIKASAKYTEVARSKLGEVCQASPAFVGGRIYIRGENHLFCIGEK